MKIAGLLCSHYLGSWSHTPHRHWNRWDSWVERWNTWALESKCRCGRGKDARYLAWGSSGAVLVPKEPRVTQPSLMLGLRWGPRCGDRGCKNGSPSETDVAILVKTVFTRRKSFSAQSTAMWHCSAVSTILAEPGVCLSICPTHLLCFCVAGSMVFSVPVSCVIILIALSTQQPIDILRPVIGVTLPSWCPLRPKVFVIVLEVTTFLTGDNTRQVHLPPL